MVVYPRWRGELVLTDKNNIFCGGLSPLARGTLPNRVLYLHGTRFIPAGAGNSTLHPPNQQPRPVYPRWRGELMRRSVAKELQHGLSPLARGTL